MNFKLCVTLCTLLFASVLAQLIEVSKTEFELSSDLYWVDNEVALALATTTATGSDDRLFRTDNGGKNWTDITNQLNNVKSSPIYDISVNPHNPTRIIISGLDQVSWYSTDRGASWNVVNPGALFITIQFHPTQADWALAIDSDFELFLTKDGGKSWSVIKTGVYDFNWGDAGQGEISINTMYYILLQTGKQVPFDLVMSEDFGVTETILLPHAYQILFFKKHLVSPIYLSTANEVSIKASPDLGKKGKNFFEAEFQFGDALEYNQYAFLDDVTGALYVGVNHQNIRTSHWGNIYTSDSTGSRYLSSLEHVKILPLGSSAVLYDFDGVYSLEGVYMANVVSNWRESTTDPVYDKLQTFLTLNNGAKWRYLDPPHFDANGQPIHCSGDCYLHLHSYTSIASKLNRFYSTPSAIGLIIGVGNVGEHLSNEESELNTYLSRDGGLSWKELYKGSTIYEIGDHGGIIVLAPYGVPTDTIYYTTDFGNTSVRPFKFSETAVTVENIVTEPNSKSEKFVVLTDSAVFSLDFTKIFPRVCDELKDYEHFSPSNGRVANGQAECLMGRTVTYKRRKTDSECFNNDDLDAVVFTTHCTCTEDDYECDFGWTRSSDGTCAPAGGYVNPTYPPENCPPGSTYYKTKGYLVEPGNSCQGGVDHKPEGPFDCPGEFDPKTSKGWIAALILVPLVIAGILVGGCFAIRSSKLQEKLPFLKSMASWKIGYFQVQPETLVDDDDFSAGNHNNRELDDEDIKVETKNTSNNNANNSDAFFDP